MSNFQDWDFEELDQFFSSAELESPEWQALDPENSANLAIAPTIATVVAILSRVCTIWKGVRTILRRVAKFRLFPKKWRRAIDRFIQAIDQLCKIKDKINT